MSLYCMKCNRHVIALLYHHAVVIVVEIMTVLWRWRSKAQDDDGHIMSHILIACDVNPFMHLILFKYDGSIIR